MVLNFSEQEKKYSSNEEKEIDSNSDEILLARNSSNDLYNLEFDYESTQSDDFENDNCIINNLKPNKLGNFNKFKDFTNKSDTNNQTIGDLSNKTLNLEDYSEESHESMQETKNNSETQEDNIMKINSNKLLEKISKLEITSNQNLFTQKDLCSHLENTDITDTEITDQNYYNSNNIDRFKRYFSEFKTAKKIDEADSSYEITNMEIDTCKDEEIKHPYCIPEFEHVSESQEINDETITIQEMIPDIMELLKNNQILIVKGDTGCGKSTIMPRLLMEQYKNIVCTQPRRLAAINIAKKVSFDLNCKIGTTVGYSIRFKDMTSKDTKLRFVTDGILLKELCGYKMKKINDERSLKNKINKILKKKIKSQKPSQDKEEGESDNVKLNNNALHNSVIINNESLKIAKIGKYDLIIIDEAHERTLNIDFLLGYLKEIFDSRNISTRLLITSATLNLEKLIKFFNCPVLEVKQKRFEISYFYLKYPVFEDYIPACIRAVTNIVKHNKDGSILVFLSGQDEIRRVEMKLQPLLAHTGISILKLYSSMPEDEQDLVFQPGNRKIILSTNIAETSITIDEIKFVVDSGKVRINRRCSESSIEFLEINSISKAQAKQRAGRSGRTQSGYVYRIYTHEQYQLMEENQTPEILRSNISNIVLAMKCLGINDIYNFKFVDAPLKTDIDFSIRFLYYLKALDSNGMITHVGKRIARMPLQPEIGICLVAASKIGCLNSVATIAAFLDFQSIFLDIKSDHPKYKEYKKVISKHSHPKGDFYMFLEIYKSWQNSKFSVGFLKENFLDKGTMFQIKQIRLQLLSFFPYQKDTNQEIERAFCTGFFMNVAKRDEKSYKTIFGNFKCHLNAKDSLFRQNPKYVLFYELFCVRKEHMHHCIEIDEDILYESVNTNYHLN